MSKFFYLASYVEKHTEDSFVLSFEQIEELIGSRLPDSARNYPTYWSPSPTHSIANAVLEKGYRMRPNLIQETVLFYKVESSPIRKTTIRGYRSFAANINCSKKLNLNEQVNKFVELYQKDANGRYKSYDHCRSAFVKYRKDPSKRDYITLQLYAYLGSWGMFRNSFLQQKDYLFSRPVVDILCKDEYGCLYHYDSFATNNGENHKLIMKLAREISNYYVGKTFYDDKNRKQRIINNVTDTLISKIILGSIGCTVAYDRYVKSGLRNSDISSTVSYRSLKQLDDVAKSNEAEIKNILKNLNNLYTPAKVLDMYFFEKGFELELSGSENKEIDLD